MRNLWLGCLVYLIYVPGRTRYRYTHLYIHMYAYKTSFVYNQCAHIYIYYYIHTIFIYTSGITLYCLQPNLIMRIKTTLPPTFRPTIKSVLDSSPDHWKTSKFAELCSTHYVCWSTNQTWPLQVQNAPNIVSHSFDLPGTSWRSPGKLLERLAAVAAAYQSLGDTSSRNALRHLGCC
jgi:hypothetical protein